MSELRSGRLAILLRATDPDQPALCATPFFHALAASALDVQVEVHFTARSVLLLVCRFDRAPGFLPHCCTIAHVY